MTIFDKDRRRSPERLAFAIHDLVYAHTNETAFFHMALDVLLINLAGPYGLLVTEEGAGFEFDTARGGSLPIEAEPISIGESDCGDGRLLLLLRTNQRSFEAIEACRDRLAHERERLATTFGHMKGALAPLPGELPLLDFFRRGFRAAADKQKKASASQAAWGQPSSGQPELREMFREIEMNLASTDHNLDFFPLRDAGNAIASTGESEPRPRLFFAHSFARDDGTVRWRAHVLASQARWLARAVDHLNGRSRASDVKLPDHPARTIERVFPAMPQICASGVAGWIDGGLSSPGVGNTEEEQWRALVLPVHVQGVPWLAVGALFLPREDIPAWFAADQWASSFYHELFPKVIETTRQLADVHFLRRVREIALDELKKKKGKAQPAGLERALSPLYSVFPHHRIRFEDGPYAVPGLWNRRKVPISFTSNRLFAGSEEAIDYRLLTGERVRGELIKATERYAAHQWERNRGEGGAYLNISHNMKNVIDGTNWEQAQILVGGIAKEYRRRAANGSGDAALVRALDMADRALSMTPMISGLAYIGQLLGASDNQVKWSKFYGWLPADGKLPATIDIGTIAQSVARIAGAVCFNRTWPASRLDVTWAESPDLAAQTTPSSDGPLRVSELEFPPFAKGSKAAHPFFFALFEPIYNAIKALQIIEDDNHPAAGRTSLRIHVSRARIRSNTIAIDITNQSSADVNPKISGLIDAARLLERLQAVDYPLPRSRLLSSRNVRHHRLYDVTIRLRMRPLALAKAIRNGSSAQDEPDPQHPDGPHRR